MGCGPIARAVVMAHHNGTKLCLCADTSRPVTKMVEPQRQVRLPALRQRLSKAGVYPAGSKTLMKGTSPGTSSGMTSCRGTPEGWTTDHDILYQKCNGHMREEQNGCLADRQSKLQTWPVVIHLFRHTRQRRKCWTLTGWEPQYIEQAPNGRVLHQADCPGSNLRPGTTVSSQRTQTSGAHSGNPCRQRSDILNVGWASLGSHCGVTSFWPQHATNK